MTIQLKLQIRLISPSAMSAWRRAVVSVIADPRKAREGIEARRTRRKDDSRKTRQLCQPFTVSVARAANQGETPPPARDHSPRCGNRTPHGIGCFLRGLRVLRG